MSARRCPQVTLKLATSVDGRIALANGASRWITGPESRAAVHALRASHDAVLTGVGTVLADDPQMTARPDGVPANRQPIRAVADSTLRTPPGCALLLAGSALVFHVRGDPSRAEALERAGATVLSVADDGAGRTDLSDVLQRLGAAGARRVMIEAGGAMAASALRSGLVDRIEWFRAPMFIGGDGLASVAALGLETLADAPIFRRTGVRTVGSDLLETYERS